MANVPILNTMPKRLAVGERQASTVLRIGDFPLEIKDMIFEKLSNAHLLPFLFMRSTYESAHRALFVGDLALFTNHSEARYLVSVLQKLCRNPELSVQIRTLRLCWEYSKRNGGLSATYMVQPVVSQLFSRLPNVTVLDLEIGDLDSWYCLTKRGIIPPKVNEIILRCRGGVEVPVTSHFLDVFIEDTTKDWTLGLVNCFFHCWLHDNCPLSLVYCPIVQLDFAAGAWLDACNMFWNVRFPCLKRVHIRVPPVVNASGFTSSVVRPILRFLAESRQLEMVHLCGGNDDLRGIEKILCKKFPALRELTLPAEESLPIEALLQYTRIEKYIFEFRHRIYGSPMRNLLDRLQEYLDPFADNLTSRMPAFPEGRLINLIPACEGSPPVVDTFSIETFHTAMMMHRRRGQQEVGAAPWSQEIVSSPGKLKVGKHIVIDHSAL